MIVPERSATFAQLYDLVGIVMEGERMIQLQLPRDEPGAPPAIGNSQAPTT